MRDRETDKWRKRDGNKKEEEEEKKNKKKEKGEKNPGRRIFFVLLSGRFLRAASYLVSLD